MKSLIAMLFLVVLCAFTVSASTNSGLVVKPPGITVTLSQGVQAVNYQYDAPVILPANSQAVVIRSESILTKKVKPVQSAYICNLPGPTTVLKTYLHLDGSSIISYRSKYNKSVACWGFF